VSKCIAGVMIPFLLLTLMACSREPGSQAPHAAVISQPASTLPSATEDLSRLVGRIWRISDGYNGLASGSIYVFLPNGTLLETSCVETYRVATWAADKSQSGSLQVREDHRPSFMAKLGESTDTTLRLEQTLLLGNRDTRELTLTAVDQEFVCPDIRK
jgi:hypothetical protein